jgi:hypothetical protein
MGVGWRWVLDLINEVYLMEHLMAKAPISNIFVIYGLMVHKSQ